MPATVRRELLGVDVQVGHVRCGLAAVAQAVLRVGAVVPAADRQVKEPTAVLRPEGNPGQSRGHRGSAARERLVAQPRIVRPADRPRRAIVEDRVGQLDSRVPGAEERTEDTLVMRQIRGVPHHLVGVALLLLADRELADVRSELGRQVRIRDVEVSVSGLVREALVLGAQLVVELREQVEVATEHEAKRPQLDLVVLLADLRDARRVLVEPGVVEEHRQSEFQLEAVLLVFDPRRREEPVGQVREGVIGRNLVALQELRWNVRFLRLSCGRRCRGSENSDRQQDRWDAWPLTAHSIPPPKRSQSTRTVNSRRRITAVPLDQGHGPRPRRLQG